MAEKASSIVSTEIEVEVEYQIFSIERILILLHPFAQSTSTLGLLLTTILAVVRSIRFPTSRALLIFDGLFWVERVGCLLVWWSLVEGILGLWFAALFLYGFSTVIRMNRMDYSNFQLQLNYEQEKKLQKMATEIGTQTEEDKRLEEAKEITNEELEKKDYLAEDVEIKDLKDSKLLLDDANSQKKLRQMNDEWEERLNEERESRKQMIHNHITFMSKFFSDIDWLMQKVQLISSTWGKEKQELERCIEWTAIIWKNLEARDKDDRRVWEEERSYYVRKIRKCVDEIERLEGEGMEMARKLKEQEAMAEKCHMLEEENRVLRAKLHTANGLSEFYKGAIRTIDI